jgi:hypothetical protein
MTRLGSHRPVALFAVVSSGFMIIGALGAWVSYDGGSAFGGLDRVAQVSHRGWVVLIAGVAGAGLALFASRSLFGSALILVAGVFASGSVLDVREAIEHTCPNLDGGSMGAHTLGLLCLSPSVGWGLNVATIGSLGLFAAGAVLLSVSVLPRLPRRPNDRALRDVLKKYAS